MLERLSVASYKGVRFPCNDTTTTVGRAKIIHKFANSDKNSVEDQGLNPRVYTLTAIILGENYERDRDDLLAAIEDPGAGVLIHPFYGRIENAEALPVTFEETVKTLGRTEIPITFEISESEGIPAVTQRSTSSITNLKDSLIDSVTADFANVFNVTDSFTGNFTVAQIKNADFISTVTENVTSITSNIKTATELKAKLDNFARNSNALIKNPSQLASAVTGIVNDVSTLYPSASQTLDVAAKFFDFGDNDTPIIPTTAGLEERLSNNTVFNEAVRSTALGVAYEAAALIDYRTVNAVDTAARQLEAVYRSLKG